MNEAKAAKLSKMAEMLNSISSAIKEQDEIINRLSEVLEPVLDPSYSKDKEDSNEARDPESAAIRTLRNLNDHIVLNNNALLDLTRRLVV